MFTTNSTSSQSMMLMHEDILQLAISKDLNYYYNEKTERADSK